MHLFVYVELLIYGDFDNGYLSKAVFLVIKKSNPVH